MEKYKVSEKCKQRKHSKHLKWGKGIVTTEQSKDCSSPLNKYAMQWPGITTVHWGNTGMASHHTVIITLICPV